MTNKRRFMLIDDNLQFRNNLMSFINAQEDMEVVCCADDGVIGLQYMYQFKPEIVILDLIMPNKDGLDVLEDFTPEDNYKPVIIMLTAVGTEHTIKRAMGLGASYYFVKPIPFELMLKRIRLLLHDMFESSRIENEAYSPEDDIFAVNNEYSPVILESATVDSDFMKGCKTVGQQATIILHRIGVASNLKGFKYLREAITLTVNEPNAIDLITKYLYPSVARLHETNSNRVERAIRHAVATAWQHEGAENYKSLFSFGGGKDLRRKPSNGEFIATIADYLVHYNNQ